MTRLPVLHQRPRTLAECRFLGAPAPKSADSGAKSRPFPEVIAPESDDDGDEQDEEDSPNDELDEQLDAAAERNAEQLRNDGGVPCPFVGCADHLAWLAIGVADPRELSEHELLEVLPRLEALDLDTLPATCAQRGPYTLEETGWFFDVTRERIRQMEAKALKRLRHPAHGHLFRGLRNEGHELSRPDLNDARTSIGLNAETITAAQRKFIPQMMVAADAARAHALHGLKHRAKGTSRCATKDCTNDRARYSRDVAAALLPLCGRCRATARKENGIPVRRHAPKLYTVRGESLSLEQWGARFECSAAAVTARAKYYKRSYEDEIEQRLVELDAKARAPVVEPPAAAPAPAPEPAAVAPVEPPSPPPAPVADPLTHAATVHEVFEHVVTNAKPEPAPEMIEIGDVKLTLRGWGYYLDLKRPELQRIQLLASKGGPSLVDELARLLAVKRAGRKPVIAKPAPAPIATTARVFEQVFASAPAPAPSEPTPALEPAAEQLTHDVDAPELEPEPETIAPPSIAPDAPVDASAPAAREDHVQTEPTITAAAPPKAVAAPRKRTHKPEPKHAPARRVRSELDAFVRDAARAFSAIASRVGKGR